MEPAGSIVFYPFVAFVLAAPLYKAGNRPLPLLLLELAAIAFLAVLAFRGGGTLRLLPRTLLAAIALALLWPLAQLVPLPEALWRALPSYEAFAAVHDRFAAPGGWRAISVVPAATEYAWLALLPPLAGLLVARSLAPAQVLRLLVAMAVAAGVMSLVGLVQVAGGKNPALYLGYGEAHGTATGPYVNRDHFAGLLAMMLPVIVGLVLYGARRAGRGGDDANAKSRRVLVFASAVLVLLCLALTFSRAGIATALVGLGALVLLAAPREGERRSHLVVAGLAATGLGLAAAIGLDTILGKFDPDELKIGAEGRLALTAATLRAAREFLPFGSGLGTFAGVFPRFQGGMFGGYVAHAHNDYAQLLLELGVAAPVLVALVLTAYVARMSELVARSGGRSFTVLQLAAGVALLPALLHALFDFGLHMPASALWFATLAGVMLHPGLPEHTRAAAPRMRTPRPRTVLPGTLDDGAEPTDSMVGARPAQEHGSPADGSRSR